MIEDNSEEPFFFGDEEVKFIKPDLLAALKCLDGQSKHLLGLIKYSITGNLK